MPYSNKAKRDAYHRAYYMRNKERMREQQREYYIVHREELIAATTEWQVANPDKRNENTRRQRTRYPEKYRARTALQNAVRDGKVVRLPCEVCGAEKVDAHHADYNEPLEATWLCRAHHVELHHPLTTLGSPATVKA